MTGPVEPRSSLLGQAGERPVVSQGWVGEHPHDGGPVAHVLLHPAGHGVAAQMRALADALGLQRADTEGMPDLDPERARAAVDQDSELHLWGPGGEFAHRPVTGAWWAAARARGRVVLWVGMDPLVWTEGDWDALNTYLGRDRRLYGGLVAITN